MINFEDIDKLSKKQQQVLGCIAINEDEGHHPATLKVLEERGFIKSYEETLPGRFPVVIKRYFTPLPVHYIWCYWCAQQPDFED